MQRLRSIQVLRAVAVLPVVFFHFSAFPVGRCGVDLFFCISGFVMAGQMSRSPTQFALDRFTRVYPPFLAALLLYFLFHPAVPEAGRLARSLALWPYPTEIYLFPGWSLGYEAMFYAACVAAMFIGGRAVVAAFAVLFLLHVPIAGSGMCLEFLAGFVIARRQWLALPALLVAAAISPEWRALAYGAPAAFLLWFCVSKEQWFASERWAPLVLLGDASYAVYLTHSTIGDPFIHWPLVVVIYICLGGGLAFHFAVEKPLVRLARRAAMRSSLRPKSLRARQSRPSDRTTPTTNPS